MVQLGGAPGHDAVPIGEVSAPPFARTPDPTSLFGARAARFRALAEGHQLGPYLTFLAGIAETQHSVQAGLPEPDLPAPDALARAREYGMPAIERDRLGGDPACAETVRRFFADAAALDMPETARQALAEVTSADDEVQAWMIGNVLNDSIPFGQIAEHVFVAAGLQVHAARVASRLDAGALVPVGDGLCPACGSAPVSSLIVGWEGAHGARFCCCSLCSTLWNYVRIRCTACGTTKGIGYQSVDGASDNIKAETCEECRTYLKVFQQSKDPGLDPVADDVATSALDLLVSETGLRRSGQNPYLLGY